MFFIIQLKEHLKIKKIGIHYQKIHKVNHLILLFICFLSVEVFIRSNYISLINSLIEVSKKAIKIISNKNISDHWKEYILPKYSIQMMKVSLQMLFIFLLIILFFIIGDYALSDFLYFTFSLNGIIESILFAFSYAFIRKLIVR